MKNMTKKTTIDNDDAEKESVTIKKVVIHYSDGSTETIGEQDEPMQPLDYSSDDFFSNIWNPKKWWPSLTKD